MTALHVQPPGTAFASKRVSSPLSSWNRRDRGPCQSINPGGSGRHGCGRPSSNGCCMLEAPSHNGGTTD
eukprot:5428182-Prorocentrum_lima.AAC.1